MKIVVTRPIPEVGIEMLKQAGHEVLVLPHDRPCTRTELLAATEAAQGVLTMLTDKIDGEFLQQRPGVKAIANYAVGYNNIDIAACQARGVCVSNTPDVLTDATAEVAWTLLMMAARRAGEGERMVRARQWSGWGPMQFQGMCVLGQTIGIIGAGRIGTRVAQMGKGFGMRVIYVHQRESEAMVQLDARRVELPELLKDADFVSIHVPLTANTRHLVGTKELQTMKKTAVLINTARGPVVDEAALVEALKSKIIFAAGLDVYEEEPKIHPGLFALENVVMLPHIGSATVHARNEMSQLAADNLLAMLRGERGKTQIV
ncbi:MAG: D-glycerate dehydrogenase [Phycisphaerales bacterium]|nr:D-glycerate dehydrogenase [Phycisphaerales bacterium]